MSRARPSRGTILTAVLLAAAFLAGSATYLALKDSFSTNVDPGSQEEPYYLIPSQVGSATAVEEELAEVDLGDPEPEAGDNLVAVRPDVPAEPVVTPEESEEVAVDNSGNSDSVPVLASGDVPVKQLYIKPVEGPISKKCSNGDLVYSGTLGDYRTHSGTDISAEIGAKVRAMADGTISDMYFDDMLGSVIEITHEDGTLTRYCNLLENHVSGIKVGVTVKMGDVISGVGQTALSENNEEVHLHVEVIRNGVSVDPETLFQ